MFGGAGARQTVWPPGLLSGKLPLLSLQTPASHLQLHAVHAADARVITASDYTVLIEGVPASLTSAELQEWCSHYGSGEVLSATVWQCMLH